MPTPLHQISAPTRLIPPNQTIWIPHTTKDSTQKREPKILLEHIHIPKIVLENIYEQTIQTHKQIRPLKLGKPKSSDHGRFKPLRDPTIRIMRNKKQLGKIKESPSMAQTTKLDKTKC